MSRTSKRKRPAPWPVPGVHSPATLYCGDNSVLYRAKREASDTSVVVKLLNSRASADARDEIELWRMLSTSKGIQPLLQFGVTDSGRSYAVLEDCPEGSYDLILARQGPLSVDEVLAVGTAVARALAAMHTYGLLHHAVVPANILRARFGPTLIDFGSAAPLLHPFPPAYYTRRTLEHTPPEELRGAMPGSASDIYRLASTMWTLLAGYPPFENSGTEDDTGEPAGLEEYRSRLLTSPAPPLPREDVPDWLRDALRQALAKDPALRMHSAEEFAQVLWREKAPEPPDEEPEPAADQAPEEPAEAFALAVPLPPAEDPAPAPAAEPESGYESAESEPLADDRQYPGNGTVSPFPHALQMEEKPRSGNRRLGLYALAAVALIVVSLLGLGASYLLGSPSAPEERADAAQAPEAEEGEKSEEGKEGKEEIADEEVADAVEDAEEESPPASAEDIAPTGVKMRDGTISVALSWTDNTGGAMPHYIVGGPVGSEVATMADIASGGTKAEVNGLNPDLEYCFRVVAVQSTDVMAPSAEVCTDRDGEEGEE
ncbi:MAG: protein kinase [Nocardiopsaceae bacterium]|nr:protein kinase [Nocardiopsaceae bacterium]